MNKKGNTSSQQMSSSNKTDRRRFIGLFGATVAGAAAAMKVSAATSRDEKIIVGPTRHGDPSARRMNDCFKYRLDAAESMKVNAGVQLDNGDTALFSDFSGSYSKALPHDHFGIPNAAAYVALQNACARGSHTDFNNLIVGTPGGGPNSKLNGPQGCLAFDLEGLDSHATVIPSAPSVASAQTAFELVEHYWAALLRDVPFKEYSTDPLVGQAVADLNSMSFVGDLRNNQVPRPITRQNLFRGQFVPGDGNVQGPYLSQFMVQPAYYGSQFLDQKHKTFLPLNAGGAEYMTTVAEYQLIQNGGDSGRPINYDPTPRYLRSGRDMAAYTSVDVLYQAYFTAFLVLAAIGAPLNPGNPYRGSTTQKPFGTLGGPDTAGTLGEMATRALKASWFHKWVKDMRQRPEEVAALVHAKKTGASPMPQAANALHPDVLNSSVLPLIYNNFDHTYLLPQPFPEGSPTHPCYPTGHGTVGGACITLLKFFFDGGQKLRPLLTAQGRDLYEPTADGLSLGTYGGPDAAVIDINGELNKLAWNVSTGHGIHAGIHFRSSTYWSIQLGEQVALSILQDRAGSYNEPFSISIKKFDGTTATINNQ
jgi:hypothetical protein